VANQYNTSRQHTILKKPTVVILWLLALGLTTFIVVWLNLSWRVDISSLPPDSGFYAYIGKAILHGQIPYRDVWDDKPPLGYYLNALALLFFGQTAWGVWWSSVAWITGCMVLLFLVIKKLLGGIPAGISCAIFLVALMNPEIFQGGNLMEVYSLAPQIGVIGITFLFFNKHRKPWFSMLVGVLTACAFLIKQPTIILGCSSILIMTIGLLSERKIHEAFISVLGFLLGISGLMAAVSVYWLWIGAFNKLLDGAFLQGLSFIGGSESHVRETFFYTLVKVIPNLYIGRLYIIAMLTAGFFLVEKLYQFWLKPVLRTHLSLLEWCGLILCALIPLVGKQLLPNSYYGKFWLISIFLFGLYFLVKFYRLRPMPVFQQVFSPIEWTWLIAVVSLPLEVLMVSLGGRYLGHYFITMLPSVIITIAYPTYRVVSYTRGSLKSKEALLRNAVYWIMMVSSLLLGTILLVQDLPSAVNRKDFTGIFKNQPLLNNLEQYIIGTTKPEDEVLVWHIHLGINFVTDRKAPSRFLFPVNLFIPPSEKNTKLEEYINDLEGHPPELILVQKPSSLSVPFVDDPVDSLCKIYCSPEFEQAIKVPQIRQEWLRLQHFFYSNYALDTRIYDWTVYRKLP
jgi:4-amino-4-deoxy-L-arabinose transferase-like glycosyltransferase